jgi:protein dithiol:quinone oxidoreductase
MNSRRFIYIAQLLAVALLLVFAYYLEKVEGMLPCPLCELQRILYLGLGVLFLINSFPKRGWRLVNLLTSLTALCGALLALRQVWLHYEPMQPYALSVCDTNLGYLMQIMPLKEVLMNVIIGGPGCAKVAWQFLHLSIAEWSLLWFSLFVVLGLWKTIRP